MDNEIAIDLERKSHNYEISTRLHLTSHTNFIIHFNFELNNDHATRNISTRNSLFFALLCCAHKLKYSFSVSWMKNEIYWSETGHILWNTRSLIITSKFEVFKLSKKKQTSAVLFIQQLRVYVNNCD